jgi:hypothetical protein
MSRHNATVNRHDQVNTSFEPHAYRANNDADTAGRRASERVLTLFSQIIIQKAPLARVPRGRSASRRVELRARWGAEQVERS